MTAEKTLRQLAAGVKLVSHYGKNRRDIPEGFHAGSAGWRCHLRYKGRQFSVDYFQGPAAVAEPRVAELLDCLLSDAQGGGQSFEEFCSEFGYDQDSRKALAAWNACKDISKGMRRLLGDDFDTFLHADRND